MKKLILYLAIIFILSSQVAYAQSTGNEYKLLEPLPAVDGSGKTLTDVNLDTYIEYVFKFSIALAVLLAIIMIIWGGFEYMVSEAPFVKTNAKGRITNAVIGLLAALVSYLILLTIDPRLVMINSSIKPVEIDTSDVLKFTNILQADIETAAQATKLDIKRLEGEIVAKEKALLALQNDCRATKFDEEYCSREIAKLDQEIRKSKVLQYKSVTQQIGLSKFNDSLNILNDPKNYTESSVYQNKTNNNIYTIKNSSLSEDLEEQIAESKNTIRNKYNEYIQKIKTLDPEASQLLERQRDFYISEIDNEATVNGYVIAYKNNSGFLDGNVSAFKKLAKQSMENEIEKYRKEYDNPEKGRRVGLELEYQKLVEKRVSLMENTLREETTIKNPNE